MALETLPLGGGRRSRPAGRRGRMAKKKGRGRKPPSERSCARLDRQECNAIERLLYREKTCREIARQLERVPSTVSEEVARHRFANAPKSLSGEPAPDDLSGACERLQRWPRRCNGCWAAWIRPCTRRLRVRHSAPFAQLAADQELGESRCYPDVTLTDE